MGKLVLGRHKDEQILIGDNIVITIVSIEKDNVRIGIEAPPEIPVHRKEVADAIERDGKNKDPD